MLRKLLIILGGAAGIILVSFATFCVVDKVHEVSDLRMRTEVAESELWQVTGERDAARDEVSYRLLENERMEGEVRRLTNDLNSQIGRNSTLNSRNNDVGNQRDKCYERERDLKMRLPANQTPLEAARVLKRK